MTYFSFWTNIYCFERWDHFLEKEGNFFSKSLGKKIGKRSIIGPYKKTHPFCPIQVKLVEKIHLMKEFFFPCFITFHNVEFFKWPIFDHVPFLFTQWFIDFIHNLFGILFLKKIVKLDMVNFNNINPYYFDIQLWNSDYRRLLHKPCVNEVYLTGQNLA